MKSMANPRPIRLSQISDEQLKAVKQADTSKALEEVITFYKWEKGEQDKEDNVPVGTYIATSLGKQAIAELRIAFISQALEQGRFDQVEAQLNQLPTTTPEGFVDFLNEKLREAVALHIKNELNALCLLAHISNSETRERLVAIADVPFYRRDRESPSQGAVLLQRLKSEGDTLAKIKKPTTGAERFQKDRELIKTALQ